MNNQIKVTPLESEHLEDVGKILVRRLESEYHSLPAINGDFLDIGHTIEYIVNQKNDEFAQSYVAIQGQKVIGFVIGKKNSAASQYNYLSQISVPDSAEVNFLTHAVSDDVDANSVYRELYRALARNWVDDGQIHHSIHIAACDWRTQEAWINLGFGRHTTIAVRPEISPIETAQIDEITIKQARPDDINTVIDMAEILGKHHIDSPMFMFWPVQKKDRKLAKTFFEELLTNENNPHFIAYDNNHAVGMLSFLAQGLIPSHIDSKKNIYLFMGIVAPEAQQNGIGRTLLNVGTSWARDHDYKSSTLHVLNMNHSGWPFWEANGFLPVEYSMERIIDSRLISNNFKKIALL